METKQQQIKELKDMLATGLVNDETIIKETNDTIKQLEQEIAASTKPESPKDQPLLTEEEPRPKTVNKSSKKTEPKPATKSEKTTSTKVAYSWKQATPISQLKPVVLHCQHYHFPVKEVTPVALKGTGNHTTKQKAQPGEHLIFDEDGKLVYIMDAASFARKCNEPSSLDSHIEHKHLAEPAQKENKTVPPEKSSAQSAKADEIVNTAPSQKKQDRKSPAQILEAEINDVVKIMKKKRLSQEDAARLPEELKDIAVRVKSKATKSSLAYIEKQAKKIEAGEKLSKSEVIQLGLAVQPLIRSGRSVVMDMLFTNRKRLDPTVDGLLRWMKNPSGYDLIGVDVNANLAATVRPKRPKEDFLTLLNLK